MNQQTVEMRPPVAFGPESQPMTCPHCNAQISTEIKPEATTKTHLIAVIMCAVGCCFCAPCIYCADSCLARKHYCPNCKAYLGLYAN